MEVVDETSKMIGLNIKFGRTLVATESRFDPNCICKNKGYTDKNGRWHEGSVDYGLCQINNRGEVLDLFYNKQIKLVNGKEVTIDFENYKNDFFINARIGLGAFKQYLDKAKGNVFVAYVMYNGGSETLNIFKEYDVAKLSIKDVIHILNFTGKAGYFQIATNLEKNFYEQYKIYCK